MTLSIPGIRATTHRRRRRCSEYPCDGKQSCSVSTFYLSHSWKLHLTTIISDPNYREGHGGGVDLILAVKTGLKNNQKLFENEQAAMVKCQ